ncbi:MAG: LysR family transcriptional regulator [Bradyrhizobium sp.]|nr:LysR family transcriptional regulator [Bradyrhizobium sp.]
MAFAGFGAILAPEHAPRLPSLAAISIEGDPVRREVQILAVAGRQYSPALDAFTKVARVRDWTSALDKRRRAPASNKDNVRKATREQTRRPSRPAFRRDAKSPRPTSVDKG